MLTFVIRKFFTRVLVFFPTADPPFCPCVLFVLRMEKCARSYGKLAVGSLQPFKRRIKSHLLFAGIIRSSPFSPR